MVGVSSSTKWGSNGLEKRVTSDRDPAKDQDRGRPYPEEPKLKDLAGLLGHDAERPRVLLRELLREVLLQPTAVGMVTELRGNVQGLLQIEKALPGLHGSGGRI